ncbi:MAG: hypothetical protein ACOX8R_09455 [Bacillota bacterium]|jgi:hypothetical protein
MKTAVREFPYEKVILLNTIYDVLERLDFLLEQADSRAGVLRFAQGSRVGEMDLTAVLKDGAEVTRLNIRGPGEEVPAILFDEIAAALYRTFESKPRRMTQ